MIYQTHPKLRRSKIPVSCPDSEKKELDSLAILAAVGHEIRNPLNAVMGLSQLLHTASSMEEVKSYTEILMQTSENLIEMVNNLMDFSRLNTGKRELNLKSITLQEHLEGVLKVQRQLAEGKDLAFFMDIDKAMPHRLITDPVKLGQVILNLVSNAVKFTSTGAVRVRASLMGTTDSEVQLLFSVEDTGKGIAREYLDSIFNAFHQGEDDTNGYFGGTGLGLTISQQLVKVLGGRLVVESEPGKGAIFSFKLTAPIATGST